MAETYPEISTEGVVGVNGVIPVYQPEARWCWWSLNEIWDGGVGSNTARYVPKVDDYVVDPSIYETYIVTHIDPVTLIPNLRVIRPANMVYSLNEIDVLFGVGPGTQADTYRVYLDKTVTPFVLAVDARLRVAGSMCKYCKIFKGSNLTGTGQVISRVYSPSFEFLTDKIPLELVAIDNHTNYEVRIVSVCHTNADLKDGEVVTAVMYDDNGHVVSKRQLLIENTGFIRSINVSQKFVTQISLESPFLSPTNDHTIEFPLNIPVNSLILIGVVHYSDGTTLRLNVDGTKFKLHGLDQFISTIIGQKVELALTYTLGENEVAYGVNASFNKIITEPYDIIVSNPNNSVAVKLFGYPVWINDVNGYKMHWYLYNLDRNITVDVTDVATFSAEDGFFDQKGYGVLQRKTITLNLKEAIPSYPDLIHVQVFEIVLRGQPNTGTTPWTVNNNASSNPYTYGEDLFGRSFGTGRKNIDISSNIASQSEWLMRLYHHTYPLINRQVETQPPTPSHFIISYGAYSEEYPISSWNSTLTMNVTLPLYSTLFIKFIKKNGLQTMNLSIAAIMIKQ